MGRVQDTNGMLERKEKKTMEERERNTIRKTGLRVKKCEKIKSKRKMDECRAE
jgi:hypothetical protein